MAAKICFKSVKIKRLSTRGQKKTLNFFCVLSLFFGGKCKFIGGSWEHWELAFRMYASAPNNCFYNLQLAT